MDEIKSELVDVNKKTSQTVSSSIGRAPFIFLLFMINVNLPIVIDSIYSKSAGEFVGLGAGVIALPYSFVMIFVNILIFKKIKSRAIAFLVCLLLTVIFSYLSVIIWRP
jgi:hypothetical protein